MKANPNLGKWLEDRTSNAFMEFLDVLVTEHAAELACHNNARQAVLDLSTHAESRQLTAALALQERLVGFFENDVCRAAGRLACNGGRSPRQCPAEAFPQPLTLRAEGISSAYAIAKALDAAGITTRGKWDARRSSSFCNA